MNPVLRTDFVNIMTGADDASSKTVSKLSELKEKVVAQMNKTTKKLEELETLKNELEKAAWKHESNFITIRTLEGGPMGGPGSFQIGPFPNATTRFKDVKNEIFKTTGIPVESIRFLISGSGKQTTDDELLIMGAFKNRPYEAHVIRKIDEKARTELKEDQVSTSWTSKLWKFIKL